MERFRVAIKLIVAKLFLFMADPTNEEKQREFSWYKTNELRSPPLGYRKGKTGNSGALNPGIRRTESKNKGQLKPPQKKVVNQDLEA